MPKDDSGFTEIEDYTRKLAQNPESLVFVPLAEAYRKSGLLDKAIETCLKGLQLHPSYMSARMVLGRAYLEKEQFVEAIEEFQKVAQADVNNIMAHSLLGQIYVKQLRFAEAVKAYQKVLTLNPDDANAQQMLNKALKSAKDSPGPAPTAESVTEKDKNAKLTKAEEYSRQGDLENAIRIYQLILEGDPNNAVVKQRLKDLEIKQNLRKEKPAPPAPPRDNDKITSEDILSVMKDSTALKNDPAASAEAAPKKAAPVPITPKPVTKATALNPGQSDVLDKLIQTDGIIGMMLLDLEGHILAEKFRSAINAHETASTVLLIFSKTQKSIQVMQYGQNVNQILISGELGQIIFNRIGNKLLLVLANNDINLGKMRLAMNDVVKVLRS
jgi:tetratricopeptide (TPR) repeat protein